MTGRERHEFEIAPDAARAAHLQRLGYRVFRAQNIDIYDNLDGALDSLLEFIDNALTTPVERWGQTRRV